MEVEEPQSSDIEANVEHLISTSKTTYASESVAPYLTNKLEQHMANYKNMALRKLRSEKNLVQLEELLNEGKYPKSFNIIKPVISSKGEELQKKFNEVQQECLQRNARVLKDFIIKEIDDCTKMLGKQGSIMQALTSEVKAIITSMSSKATTQEREQYDIEMRAAITVALNRLEGTSALAKQIFDKQQEQNSSAQETAAGQRSTVTTRPPKAPFNTRRRAFQPYPQPTGTPYWQGPTHHLPPPLGRSNGPSIPFQGRRGFGRGRGRGTM